jgi:hypothetical protein
MPKGGRRPGAGRPRGSANRVNKEFRDTVRKLLEDNAANVAKWLNQVAEGHGQGKARARPDPARALDLLAKLAEYAAPKLSRAEMTGKAGKDLGLPPFINLVFVPAKRAEQ